MSIRPSTWQLGFAMDCNLRCTYCSTAYGTYGSLKGQMKKDVQEQLVDFALDNAPESKTISFQFGVGETFMFFDEFLSMADHIFAQAENKKITANILVTTNGTLLDKKKMDLLAERDITLMFSIDGPEHIHDRCRRDLNGQGSFDRAIKNWEYYKHKFDTKMTKGGCSIETVLSDNFSLKEVIEFWKTKGENIFTCKVQLPGYGTKDSATSDWKSRQASYIEQLNDFGMGLAEQLSIPQFLSEYQGPKDLYSFWTKQFLEQGSSSCGAGTNVAAVDIKGNIYPCEYFIKSEKWILGNVHNGISQSSLEAFQESRHKALSICANCRIKQLCPRNCLAEDPSQPLEDNVKNGCAFAEKLVKVAKDTFSVLSKTTP